MKVEELPDRKPVESLRVQLQVRQGGPDELVAERLMILAQIAGVPAAFPSSSPVNDFRDSVYASPRAL